MVSIWLRPAMRRSTSSAAARELAENLAYYFGHDATGQLEHYGNHIEGRDLIAYRNNYMTGNDADTISMHAPGTGTWKAHGENALRLGRCRRRREALSSWATPSRPSITAIWPTRSRPTSSSSCGARSARSSRPMPSVRPAHSITLTSPTSSSTPSPTTTTTFAVGLVPDDAASVTKYKEAPQGLLQRQGVPDLPVLHRQPGPQPRGQRFEQLLEHQLHRAAPSV